MRRRKADEPKILNTLTYRPLGTPRFVGYRIAGSSWSAAGPGKVTDDLDEALAELKSWIEAGFPAVSISREWEYVENPSGQITETAE